ncbi:MAG: glycoside hydrolase family 2 [Erysipelotrichaceae bacterium]|nr:glycoside hydrolase family 2 [Erysipelotrichaceae bacterium]MDY5253013.1 glycoside hydrolase family 2 TIM barrel-domain containing protein [Erysipelotrichaceae bacterium]
MQTRWAKKIDVKKCFSEYPRMHMQRDSYTCLNGIWQYEITSKDGQPGSNYQNILVPFPVGSPLSNALEVLKDDEVLWYRKRFSYRRTNERTILHFEAVDQKCVVYLNNVEVGMHSGGYLPFSMDVTRFLQDENVLIVAVSDRSDKGIYAYGKQKLEAEKIWYKPTAGIWGTVWLEDVCERHIEDIKITPLFDDASVFIQLFGDFEQAVITVRDNGQDVFKDIVKDKQILLKFDQFKAWTPDNPFLYDVYIETADDYIKSYFGMRKFSKGKDRHGHVRFMLNNKPLFLTGLLDQGYNCDGLYTYPSDEAMIYELQTVKEMGFNMLRKHVKIENHRWYYHCDRLGILVMQDMVNGGNDYDMSLVQYKGYLGFKVKDDDYAAFGRDNEKSRSAFEKELFGMINHLYNHPCIFSWVIFNEGWGQFDSLYWVDRVKEIDQTRLIDHASGWFDQKGGDFKSRHVYFGPYIHLKDRQGRIEILSEFGGYAYREYGHSLSDKVFGYKKFKEKLKLGKAIYNLYDNQIRKAVEKGLGGCIYTQLSDVETEMNGLFTYDREILKVEKRMMNRINRKLIRMVK